MCGKHRLNMIGVRKHERERQGPFRQYVNISIPQSRFVGGCEGMLNDEKFLGIEGRCGVGEIHHPNHFV